MRKIILASSSERRKAILKQVGIKPIIDESKINEESFAFKSPLKLARELSLAKVNKIAPKYKDAIIIGADTFVVLDNEVIGKPKSEKNVVEILKKLSGKTHTVVTGYTILDTKIKKIVTQTVTTKVTFKKLTKNEIEEYLKTNEPLGKAGAYAIQGKAGLFIEKINGDYFNIVGFPINKISEALKEFGIEIINYW
jgi:septum formation protein